MLKELRALKIHSLMVEGGATVITSFLTSGLVNFLVVTIAPIIVGDQGIGYRAFLDEEVRNRDHGSPPLTT